MSFKVREMHWHVIIDYMSRYPDLARGRLNSAAARQQYKKLWADLAQKLNSVGLGQKPVEKWQKTWTDYKQNLKKKAAEIHKHREQTGGGPHINKTLTDLELKILAILGDTFFKGIGVSELGITQPEGSFNNQLNNSGPSTTQTESVPLQTLPGEPEFENYSFALDSTPVTTRSALIPQTSKDLKPVFSEVIQINSRNENNIQSGNFNFPVNISEQPKNQVTSASFCSPSSKRGNTQISTKKHIFRKRVNDQHIEDHDYLANIPSDYKKRRTVRQCEEDELSKIYSETVEVLHSINSNITEGLHNMCDSISNQNTNLANINKNVEDLTNEIRSLTNVIRLVLEKPNCL